jgi:two-component sensor histidine kinase
MVEVKPSSGGVPYSILIADLLQALLAKAENPRVCAELLGESIRGLIGVKSVFVIRCSEASASHRHELLSAVPARRADLAADPRFLELLEASHLLDGPTALGGEPPKGGGDGLGSRGASRGDRMAGGSEPRLRDLAAALDRDLTIIVPLSYSGRRMGAVVLLGIMDQANIAGILDALSSIAGVFALILRNAFLYENLEDAVSERTAWLEDERAKLQKALDERQVLLREIHHRVKNNLQIVDSLLHLQCELAEDAAAAEALLIARSRIGAMSMVHQELYAADELSTVELSDYVPKLVMMALQAAAVPAMEARFEIAPARASLGAAIPLGLIINELTVETAVKRAVEGEPARLFVGFKDLEGAYELRMAIEGAGDVGAAASGLGRALVEALAGQLGARFAWEPSGGSGFTLYLSAEALKR